MTTRPPTSIRSNARLIVGQSRVKMAAASQVLAAAPPTAAVYEMRMGADALAAYDASETLSEAVRKSATYDALRYSRGKGKNTPA